MCLLYYEIFTRSITKQQKLQLKVKSKTGLICVFWGFFCKCCLAMNTGYCYLIVRWQNRVNYCTECVALTCCRTEMCSSIFRHPVCCHTFNGIIHSAAEYNYSIIGCNILGDVLHACKLFYISNLFLLLCFNCLQVFLLWLFKKKKKKRLCCHCLKLSSSVYSIPFYSVTFLMTSPLVYSVPHYYSTQSTWRH